MNSDLLISHINSVYYCRTDHWSRSRFAPRRYDGIVLFTEGEIEYHFADRKLTARKGDLLFLPGDLPYSGVRKTENTAFYVLDFTCLEAYLDEPAVCAADAETEERFRQALRAWECRKTGMLFTVKSVAYELLGRLCRERDASDPAADRIVQYIARHLDDPELSNRNICEALFLSPSTLRRTTFAATGLTPGHLLTRLRIDKAKNALRYSDRPVKQIARECGFSSPYYFSRCFHEETGLSPTAFREQFGTAI